MLATIDTAPRFHCLLSYLLPLYSRLTNNDLAVLREVVLGYLEVERCGSLSYAAGDVVVGTVAGAEPAAEVASLANGDTTKMGADTCCLLACWSYHISLDCGYVPSMINHSGFFTRSPSAWGSRSASHFVSSASLISSSVRCRMKTGLPRHLIMTCHKSAPCIRAHEGWRRTFLPSGMAARSISTLAWAKTSAEADMLTRKSATQNR